MATTDLQKKNELRQELLMLDIALELIDGFSVELFTPLQIYQKKLLERRKWDIQKALED